MNTFENSTKKLVVFIIFLFFIMSTTFVMNWRFFKPPIRISKQSQKVTIDKNIIDILSFGNRRFVSSIYWVETLLDSDLKHYQKKDLNNWMFNRFDTITTLDPRFYEAYLFGGIYLSIVKDDELGAKTIYEKGLKVFPDDLELLYNAGFNDYFELADEDSAVEKFERIGRIPGGIEKYPFIISLGQKIRVENGLSLEEIYPIFLDNFKKVNKDNFVKSFYEKTLYGLRAEIDLACLNDGRTDCRKMDFNGKPYIQDPTTGKYKSVKKWKPFRVRTKVKN